MHGARKLSFFLFLFFSNTPAVIQSLSVVYGTFFIAAPPPKPVRTYTYRKGQEAAQEADQEETYGYSALSKEEKLEVQEDLYGYNTLGEDKKTQPAEEDLYGYSTLAKDKAGQPEENLEEASAQDTKQGSAPVCSDGSGSNGDEAEAVVEGEDVCDKSGENAVEETGETDEEVCTAHNECKLSLFCCVCKSHLLLVNLRVVL